MIFTVTVHEFCAPQTVAHGDEATFVLPGTSLTAEFTEAQEAYIRSSPGHFSIGTDKPQLDHDGDGRAGGVKQPVQPRRRGRGRH